MQRGVNIKHSAFKPGSGVHFLAKTTYFHLGNSCSFLGSVFNLNHDLFPKLNCRRRMALTFPRLNSTTGAPERTVIWWCL